MHFKASPVNTKDDKLAQQLFNWPSINAIFFLFEHKLSSFNNFKSQFLVQESCSCNQGQSYQYPKAHMRKHRKPKYLKQIVNIFDTSGAETKGFQKKYVNINTADALPLASPLVRPLCWEIVGNWNKAFMFTNLSLTRHGSLSRRVTRKFILTSNKTWRTRNAVRSSNVDCEKTTQHFAMMSASDLFVGYMRSSMAR